MKNVPKEKKKNIEIMAVFGILMSHAHTSFFLSSCAVRLIFYVKRFIVPTMR